MNYTCKLNRFLKYCQLKENDYDSLLFDDDNKLIQSKITDFLIHIQAAGLSSATVRQHVTAVRFFYEMNDITTLNWKKISKVLSEYKRVANDRPYTREEIKKMLERTDQRNRIIILLMCSLGMRQGAIHSLKLGHLEKMQQDVYKL